VVRDYIYIGDAVDALLKAATYQAEKNAPRVFNIGAGEGYSLNELIANMKEVCDVPVEVKYTPSRPEDVPANVLDISAARQWLQWSPKIRLKEGLSRTWSWLKSLEPARAD
jgi:UDP-glucose 4-epimerase